MSMKLSFTMHGHLKSSVRLSSVVYAVVVELAG